MEDSQNKSGNSNMILIVAGVVGLLVLGGIGIWMAQNRNTATPSENTKPSTTLPTTGATEMTGSQSATPTTSITSGQVRTINLEAGSFYYSPKEIRVKKGETVKIVMTAADMMHDFNIDELDVKMPIVRSGNTGTVEFTPTEEGEFEFYCSVGNHRQQGQTGTLLVE